MPELLAAIQRLGIARFHCVSTIIHVRVHVDNWYMEMKHVNMADLILLVWSKTSSLSDVSEEGPVSVMVENK